MSTTLLIGRWPAAREPRLQPERRGADRDVGEDAGGEARAELGDLDRDRGVSRRPRPRPRRRRPRPRARAPSGAAGDRVDLAGDAVDAEAVDPVRGHLDLQHRLGQRQHLGQRRARRRASSSSTRMPSWSSPISSSSAERIIPSEATPRSFALRSFSPPGIRAPGRATATVCPAPTLGAPQTIVRSPSPTSTVQTRSRSASGCCSAASHLADDEVLGARAGRRRRPARPRCRSSPAARRAPPAPMPGSQYSRSQE